MDKPRVGAVILAAGHSSRMDGFKPLLRVGGMTIIERVISLFCTAGVDEIITVVGCRSEELETFLRATPTRIVRNHRYEDGMFSSIQSGVETLDDRCACFFLHPADIPLVRPATLLKLLQAFKDNPTAFLYSPQFQGKNGHPPLISTKLKDGILSHDGTGGMRGFLATCLHRSRTVEVEDPYILMDIDTPEDFHRLQRLMSDPLLARR